MELINNFLTTIIPFILVLGVIIFVHEMGHLIVAKMFDVRVLAFSLGFGKKLFGFQRGETEYKVSLLPLGGYVRLGGENPDEITDDPREFMNKPRWQRILVYLAGPVMNIVFSILLMTVLFNVGISVFANLSQIPPVVGYVAEGSAGERAGLQVGDRVVEVDGDEIDDWGALAVAVSVNPGEELPLVVERDGERVALTVTPEADESYGRGDLGLVPTSAPEIGQILPGAAADAGLQPEDQVLKFDDVAVLESSQLIELIQRHPGEEVLFTVRRAGQIVEIPVTPADEGGVGRINANVGSTTFQQYPLGQAFVQSVRFNWYITSETLKILGKIVTGQVAAKNAVSGPIEIASMTGDAAEQGPGTLAYLTVIVSLSIAIFNLLPIPLLDGGQITILLIESIRGRDLSLKLKERIQYVGFYFILALMAAVIIMDILKKLPPDLFGG
jgi:regulator of sigma E protease